MRTKNILVIFASLLLLSCGGGKTNQNAESTETSEVADSIEVTLGNETNTETEAIPVDNDAYTEPLVVSASADYEGAQIAFIKGDKLYFYYPETGATILFSEEQERIYNCVFDKTSDIIYYTVIRDEMLYLKEAMYMSDSKQVRIREIANTKINIEEFFSHTTSLPSKMYYSRGECVLLPYHYNWDSYEFDKMINWSQARGETGDQSLSFEEYKYEDLIENEGFQEIKFKMVDNNLIYKGANLSNTINYDAIKQQYVDEDVDEEISEEIEFINFKLSFDGSKLLYCIFLDMCDLAHGPMCVANTDGTHQQMILEDGVSEAGSAVWVGNQLVYIKHEKIADMEYVFNLYITDKTNNSSLVFAKDVQFFTARDLSPIKPQF